MTGETFWNNQEAAQKVINETNDIRNKIEPLGRFGKSVEDLEFLRVLYGMFPTYRSSPVQTTFPRVLGNE